MKPPLFRNDQIALDLGINVGFKKKVELRKLITENGGIVSYNVTNKCSFVVASDPEKCDISLKCRMAVKYGLPVVSLDYIWDCVGASEKLPIDRYTIGGKSKALDFRSGKISATEDKTQTSVKRFKSKSSFNVHSVHVWRSGEIEAPQFDEENYEVAKYAIFKGMKKKQDMCSFYSLEIHVASVPALLDNAAPKYRIFSHHGSLQDALAGKVCAVELRYTATADQALAGFSTLYREQTTVHKMQVVDGVAPRNVGSRKLQQILSVLETEIGVASPAVSEIVEHIWREAIGEVESVLQIPITSVKVDQVEKAEALLVKIRDGLKNKENVEDVVKEFFDTLPHKTESPYTTKPTTAWLSRKQDLCQLIKDMVSVSEATSWSARPSVQSKYRALRCNISFVEPGSYEHKNISEDIQSSVDRQIRLNITNIFTIQRPIEDPGFRADLNNKRHLFHSSKVENFLGILSRGLLLPKVVVDDYGGTRSDAGNLGSGIYFASAASTSALYSTPSKTRETRLMLIDEVALGKCCDFTHKDESLTKPPDGYNSVHGVGKKHDNTSEFQDDEYVVYNVNQQRLRYLVEFTVDSEVPGARLQIEDLYEKMDISEFPLDDIDLHDVQGVADPLSRVKPGLVGNQAKGRVELKAVHVRAKLLDLAAQVVVFQEYHNNSFSAIEAKYVFPLGDGAVVCGFEAFINDKHIVGEVKEKETAHKEYKQAISEGHGAYLMDQDEETPDVFTVSVGNLPPKAVVLIKITYVAELQVEAELISFRLPGSVAPWKQDTAANKKTQEKLDTFKVKSGKTSLQVAIEMPFDIRTLECPSHRVRVKRTASKAVVELRSDQDIQDGFHLVVGLAEIHVPRMWVERHSERPDHQACMLTFYPEFEVGSNATTDVIILLDVSNSMKGDSLQSAKKVVLLILRSLDPAWTFNVVLFGTRYKELFPNSQAQTEDNLDKAQKFIQMAQADMGNTEVFRPLHAYFLLPPVEGAMRNVLLVSDGHLNNETSVLADASSNYQHTRIFTFGVSATSNVFTLKALARVSAGAFEFFDTKVKSKWEEKVKWQLGKAGQPGLSSVAVEWRQYDDNLPQPIQAPRHITSLFNGTRQVIYGFVPNCTMALLSAIVGGQEVSTVVSTSDLAITTGLVVHRLTAHAIIQDWEVGLLSDDRTHHEVAKMNSKEDVIKLSKEFSIVTQFTSFVAIERREKDEDMSTQKGPSITELVNTEGVDILDYMGWPQQEDKPTVFKAIMLVEPSAEETLPAVSVRAKALIRKPMMFHSSYDDDELLDDLEEWSEEEYCAESALLLSDTSPSAKAYLESAPQDSIVPLQEGAVSTGMGGMHKSHEKGLILHAWSGEKYRDEIVETDTSDAESLRFQVFQNEATTLPLVSRMKQQPGFSFGIGPDRSHVTDDLMEASPASEAYLGSALQDSIVPQSQDIVPPPSALPSSKASLIRSAPQDSIVPLQQGSVPVQRAPPRSRTFSLCSSALHVSRAFQPQVLPAAMPSFGSTRRYSHDPQIIDSLERQSEEKSEVIYRSHATDDLKEAPVGARTFSSRSSALHVSRAFQTKASLERQSEGGNEVISETQSMENLAPGKSSLMTESLGADFQDIDKIRPETKKKKKAFELQEDYHHIMLDTSSDDLTISRSSASEFQEMPVSPQYEPESPQYEPESPQYEPESPQYEPESSASVFRKVSQAVFSEQQSFAYSAPQKLEKWNVSHYSFASAPPPPPLPPSGGAMGAAGLYTSQVLPPEVSSSFNVAQIEKLEHSDLLSEKKSRGVRFSSHEQDRRKSGPHFRGFLGKRVQRIPEAARLYSDPVRSELKRKPDEESRTVVDGFSCRMVGLDEWKWQMQNKMDALLLKVNDSCYLDDSIQELLSVDVEKCRKLMMSSGLGSFGQAAASEIQQLVARLLILLSIIIVNDYRWTNGEEGSKEAILFLHELLMGKNKESLKSALILESSAALKWCQAIDGKYPLACFSLELASSWPAFCGMVLGLVPEIL